MKLNKSHEGFCGEEKEIDEGISTGDSDDLSESINRKADGKGVFQVEPDSGGEDQIPVNSGISAEEEMSSASDSGISRQNKQSSHDKESEELSAGEEKTSKKTEEVLSCVKNKETEGDSLSDGQTQENKEEKLSDGQVEENKKEDFSEDRDSEQKKISRDSSLSDFSYFVPGEKKKTDQSGIIETNQSGIIEEEIKPASSGAVREEKKQKNHSRSFSSGLKPMVENAESFNSLVVRALGVGALAGLLIWIFWAVSLLSMVHFPGTLPAEIGSAVAGYTRAGLIMTGGDGLGAGLLPLYPAVIFALACTAALTWTSRKKRGGISVRRHALISDDKDRRGEEPHGNNQKSSVNEQVEINSLTVWISCIVTGIVSGSLPSFLPDYPAFAVFLGGALMGLLFRSNYMSRQNQGSNLIVLPALGLSCLAGVWVVETLASHAWLELHLPAPLPLLLYGAGMAGFIVIGTFVSHIGFASDSVRASYIRARGKVRGELSDLVESACETYRDSCAILKSRAGNRMEAMRIAEGLSGVTCRVIDLAMQCQIVSEAVGEDSELRLFRKIEDFDRKIRESTDHVSIGHYEKARASIKAQKESLDRIRMGLERAVAAIHAQIAFLERARLSVIGLQSSDSGLLMAELDLMSESLDEASALIEAEAEAMLSLSGTSFGSDLKTFDSKKQ